MIILLFQQKYSAIPQLPFLVPDAAHTVPWTHRQGDLGPPETPHPRHRFPSPHQQGSCSSLPSHARHPCWKAWVTGRALSLDSNTLLPRMLFPVALFPFPDFPTRMSLTICGVPSFPRSPGSIERRRDAAVRACPPL